MYTNERVHYYGNCSEKNGSFTRTEVFRVFPCFTSGSGAFTAFLQENANSLEDISDFSLVWAS